MVKDSGLRGPRRRRFPHRLEVVLHPAQPHYPQIHRLQRRRRRAGHHQGPLSHGRRPAPGPGRHGHRGLCRRRHLRLYLLSGANITSPCTGCNKAIDAAEAKNLLGDNIKGTGFSFHIQVQTGGGSYVCGEETALIESIEGKRGNPRVKPPFPGRGGRLEQAHHRQQRRVSGPACRASWSTAPNGISPRAPKTPRGTKIFQVVGHVNNPGVVEANCGMTVRDL